MLRKAQSKGCATAGERGIARSLPVGDYFTADHLGSTSLVTDASGNEFAQQKYYPFGTPRFTSGTLPTDYRFTGQRSEEAALGSLYDYGARFYSPALGRFIQPDTIVPEPGNPQSLNRYADVLNNALRYTDPTGMAECAAGDDQCWINEWHWKNRWYNAHGYFWGGGHWSVAGDPHFQDEGITDDVIVEAGISLASTVTPSPWSWANKQKVAYAVARFGQKLSGGIAAFQSLLGGYAVINLNPGIPFYCQGACAPPPPWTGGHDVFFAIGSFSAADLVGGAQWVVHELAHVIDWQGGFSRHWPHGDLTRYSAEAPNVPIVCRRSWERWAEAVTIWVFGNEDGLGGYVTSYKAQEISVDAAKLLEHMRLVQSFLEGW